MSFGFGGGFEFLFFGVFALIAGTVIFQIVRSITQGVKNNASPVLTVEATVTSKRADVHSGHYDANTNMHHASSTYYYATFQVQSGDRMEFSINGIEYGQLAENDFGKLTFQGTRYLGFERLR